MPSLVSPSGPLLYSSRLRTPLARIHVRFGLRVARLAQSGYCFPYASTRYPAVLVALALLVRIFHTHRHVAAVWAPINYRSGLSLIDRSRPIDQ